MKERDVRRVAVAIVTDVLLMLFCGVLLALHVEALGAMAGTAAITLASKIAHSSLDLHQGQPHRASPEGNEIDGRTDEDASRR